MRVCLCFPFFDPDVWEPEEILERYPLVAELPVALAERGHQVLVQQLGRSNVDLVHGGANYRFRSPGWLMLKLGQLLQRLRPHEGSAYYQLAWRQAVTILRWRPDIVHVFGLTLDPQLALLVRAGKRAGAKVVVHYHGGNPPRSPFARWFTQRHLRQIDCVLMTAPEQATQWIDAGMLFREQIQTVIESSVSIHPMDRSLARERTKMHGDPVFVSTGRLDPIKDPLTMLRAFSLAVEHFPDPRLYLYFRDAPMIDEVRSFVAADMRIRDRVVFRGEAASGDMGAIYSSADIFLQASKREWGGFALLEALACGCVPVVSDIPSFERLTDNGRVGHLFPVGDATAMAKQIISLSGTECVRLSDDAQAWFAASLSFDALADDLVHVYTKIKH